MDVSIRLKIKSLYNGFSPKEQQIADFILENPNFIIHNSISDIAGKLNVANSTLFQFTKKLGYSGFKDFKMAMLVQESDLSTTTIHEDIQIGDNELTMAQKVFASNIKTLSETQKLLQQKDLKKAATILSKASLVQFFGVGGSGILAEDAYQKFLRSPIRGRYSADYHLQLMEASQLNPGDCAVCISHTGRSQETVKLAEVAREHGAKVIAITSHASSPLAQLADVVLVSISEEIQFHSEALSSRISQLSILDSLFVICMFMDKDSSMKSLKRMRHTIRDTKI